MLSFMVKCSFVLSLLFFSFNQLIAKDPATLSADSINRYLSVLTSDSLEGRESGTIGQRRAGLYLQQLYEEWNIGIPPAGSRMQRHPLTIRNNKAYNLRSSDEKFLFYKDFYYPAGRTDTSFLFNQLIFCGYGNFSADYDDFKEKPIAGKVILISADSVFHKKLLPFNSNSLYQKLKNIEGKKPALVFVSVRNLNNQILELERNTSVADSLSALSFRVVFIQSDLVSMLTNSTTFSIGNQLNKINSNGKPAPKSFQVQLELNTTSVTDNLVGQNVFGYIEGTDLKGEVVIISAHYDHLGKHDGKIFHGADDDGSGTAAIMEIARLFSIEIKKGNPPRRSLLFMNTCGEEKGLLGSKWYVDHPFFEHAKTVVDLNVDMIGRIDSSYNARQIPEYVYVITSQEDSPDLLKFNDEINAGSTQLILDTKYCDPADPNNFYGRSDHYSFVRKRIPALFYFSGTHEDYHKSTDTIDKIDFFILRKRAQLIFNVAYELVHSTTSFKKPRN